jgi:hypothetical protein
VSTHFLQRPDIRRTEDVIIRIGQREVPQYGGEHRDEINYCPISRFQRNLSENKLLNSAKYTRCHGLEIRSKLYSTQYPEK